MHSHAAPCVSQQKYIIGRALSGSPAQASMGATLTSNGRPPRCTAAALQSSPPAPVVRKLFLWYKLLHAGRGGKPSPLATQSSGSACDAPRRFLRPRLWHRSPPLPAPAAAVPARASAPRQRGFGLAPPAHVVEACFGKQQCVWPLTCQDRQAPDDTQQGAACRLSRA